MLNKCRFLFPRFPSLRTLVAVPVKMLEKDPEKAEEKLKNAKILKQKVMDVLEDEEKMEEIKNIKLDEIEEWKKGNGDKEVLANFKKERLIKLLKMSNIEGESDAEIINKYEEALKISDVGYRIVLERDVD